MSPEFFVTLVAWRCSNVTNRSYRVECFCVFKKSTPEQYFCIHTPNALWLLHVCCAFHAYGPLVIAVNAMDATVLVAEMPATQQVLDTSLKAA